MTYCVAPSQQRVVMVAHAAVGQVVTRGGCNGDMLKIQVIQS
jgi:hypothetical protein